MINMAMKLSMEERAKIRFGDYWYLVSAEEREKVKRAILAEDEQKTEKRFPTSPISI